MNEKLAAFVKNLTYWLDQEHEIEATVANLTENSCDLNLWLEDASDDDDEDVEVGNNFYIGTFADPGMHITWLGEYDLGEKEKTEGLLEVYDVDHGAVLEFVNGDLQAIAKAIKDRCEELEANLSEN